MDFSIKYEAVDVEGFFSHGIHCGIKSTDPKRDLGVIFCPDAVSAAGVFTQNVAKAAPVTLSQLHLKENQIKAIVVNSGNANACTGEQGAKDALSMCHAAADALHIQKSQVLVASTGIIGVPMPMDKILPGIKTLCADVKEDGLKNTAAAILTTDTCEKAVSADINIDGKITRITGIAKGSGMIHPNMATMLGFIMTDALIEDELLQKLLSEAVQASFNMISVDGDTSTNDMVLAMASGKSAAIQASESNAHIFYKGLLAVCIELAKLIAEDGEGATKLLEMHVCGARSYENAALAAKAVISSSLVKSAFFGCDANWGRILCAIGYSGARFDPNKVTLSIHSDKGDISLMENGAPLIFDEETALTILGPDKIKIVADFQDGGHSATAWGCDLTYDYVKINGEYRS